jgi:hypothetical protein
MKFMALAPGDTNGFNKSKFFIVCDVALLVYPVKVRQGIEAQSHGRHHDEGDAQGGYHLQNKF